VSAYAVHAVEAYILWLTVSGQQSALNHQYGGALGMVLQCCPSLVKQNQHYQAVISNMTCQLKSLNYNPNLRHHCHLIAVFPGSAQFSSPFSQLPFSDGLGLTYAIRWYSWWET